MSRALHALIATSRWASSIVLSLCCIASSGCGGCDRRSGLSALAIANVGREHTLGIASLVEPPQLFEDLAKARDTLAPGAAAGRLGADLGTADGWKSIGVDLAAGITITFDERVMDARRPTPIILATVDAREVLVAALAKLGPVSLGAVSGATQELLVNDMVVGYLGTLGARTAFVFASGVTPATDLRVSFDRFVVGGGDTLSADASFGSATAELATGPGVLAYASARVVTAFSMVGLSRSERETAQLLLSQRVTAVAGRVGDEGFGARVVMPQEVASRLTSIFKPSASPPPLAALVPAKGWVAARVSVDLRIGLDGMINAILGSGFVRPGVFDDALSRAGFTWSELSDALDGHFGAALDLGSLAIALTRYDPKSANWLAVLGVANEAKADALVDKLALLAQTSGFGFTRTDTRVADLRVTGIANRYLEASIYIARRDKVLLVAPSIDGLGAALEPARETLADTKVGEVLSGSGFVAVAAEVSPLVLLAELKMRDVRELRALEGLTRMAQWHALRETPWVAIEVSAHTDGLQVKGSDGSLSYGVLLLSLVRALQVVSHPGLAIEAKPLAVTPIETR